MRAIPIATNTMTESGSTKPAACQAGTDDEGKGVEGHCHEPRPMPFEWRSFDRFPQSQIE